MIGAIYPDSAAAHDKQEAMALAVVESQPLGLCPAQQLSCAPPAETLCLQESGEEEAKENWQYQNLLSVASSQLQRLEQHGALRKCPGYDLSDPWLVAGSEADGAKPGKAREFARLTVPGMPCKLVGEAGRIVAYLGPANAAAGSKSSGPPASQACQVRLPEGTLSTYPRNKLLPLPTRPACQGDWALAVDLKGALEHLNGFRCVCGIGVRTVSSGPAFWVMFEPKESGIRPELELLPKVNLVALAGPPPGSCQTPWEARLASIAPEAFAQLAREDLEDEAAAEARRATRLQALCDGDEEDDDESMDIDDSDQEEEEEETLTVEAGSLVQLTATGCLGIVQKVNDSAVEVRLCQGPGSKVETHALASLKAISEDQAVAQAVCTECGSASPESQLLICENFAKSCSSTTHICCLNPPLKKVPEGDWYCHLCQPKGPSSGSASGKSTAAKAAPAPKAKVTAKSAPKAKATAKAKAKVLSKANSSKSKRG